VSTTARQHLVRRAGALLAGLAATLALGTSSASADGPSSCDAGVPSTDPNGPATRYTCTFPISVEGFGVKQTVGLVDHPGTSVANATISHMDVDIVSDQNPATSDPVPISRLMLHHIVFLNLQREDQTCPDGYVGFDSRPNLFGGFSAERFYAAGEERLKLTLPQGYGYAAGNPGTEWAMVYMVMNHRKALDDAFIQYSYTVSSAPQQPVTPYWLDEVNCRSDPIYNVRGTGPRGSRDVRTSDYVMPVDGRIVAGAGHVHGGARKLTLTQPGCGNRRIAESIPTWGYASHPFYNVRPILHEPGPVNMTAFGSETGIPVKAGTRIRLNAIYENSRPHVRVMGIFPIFVAEGPGIDPVSGTCDPLPSDLYKSDRPPGRNGPIPFTIPLTGIDAGGNPVTIKGPRGRFRRLRSGARVKVRDRFFSRPNVILRRGARLNYVFDSAELHNLTLANGPVGIGSPNLNQGRSFAQRFRRTGTYRFFCALHPVQMHQRVVVKQRRKRRARRR
jgi:Stress up-regulated Nod 19